MIRAAHVSDFARRVLFKFLDGLRLALKPRWKHKIILADNCFYGTWDNFANNVV